MTTGRARLAFALMAVCAFSGFALAEELEYPHGTYEGECETCHSSDGWRPVTVPQEFLDEHSFPLRDAHALETCTACHATLAFPETSAACVDCHLDPHRGELGIDCADCHVPRTFIDRTRMLRSHQSTRFPLRGSHRALDCEDCHTLQPAGALRWVNLPTACFDCHAQSYPVGHDSAGFSTECDQCHVPTVWELARFNHTGITSGCADCHQEDYDNTDDPDHAAGNFPTTCEDCHNTNTWEGAQFKHTGIVDGCVDCHQEDYDNTQDPNHRTIGYPTTCEDCHSTRSWDDGDADHESIFPLESGRHAPLWDTCSTCHVNPSNYADFSCFGCHPHSDEQKTNGDHEGREGYGPGDYDSQRCYACHPRGEAEG